MLGIGGTAMIKIGPVVDGVQVAEIGDDLTVDNVLDFISAINQVFQKNRRPFLVLDIEKLGKIDDKGVQAIRTAIYKADNNRGKIVVACSKHHPIRQTLERWRPSITFDIYDSASEAVKILKGQVPPISV